MNKPLAHLLVVSDLDGTLVAPDMTISKHNIEAIQLFCELGGNFTVATGRSIEAVRIYLNQLPIHIPVILYNGGLVYDFRTNTALHTCFLPESGKNAFLELSRAFPAIGNEVMAENFCIYLTNASAYTYLHTQEEQLDYMLADVSYVNHEWFKALFACAPGQQAELIQMASAIQANGFYFVPTSPVYFELMPEQASKGNALQFLYNYLHLQQKDTIAIGDYYNDVTLFEKAGYSVAMSGAPEDIKQMANEVTTSVENGGVGEFLYKLIKNYQL